MLDYYINYTYIVKNLCINKDKPEMHCNGKCYLKQMIKKEAREENTPNSKLPKVEISKIQFNFSNQNIAFKVEDIHKIDNHYFRTTLIPKKLILRIFRPPTFA